tara:strand:+ start:1023 stop:1808 length:786 start_codon:yes stop_codon:yes gene_type:complete
MGLFDNLLIAYSSFKKSHVFIKKHNLWHFIIIPGVLNVVLFVTLLIWLIKNVGYYVDYFFNLECGSEEGFMSLYCMVFSGTVVVIKYLIGWLVKSIFIILYLLIYKNIILLIYSPVIAFLIEKVDQKNNGVDLPFSMQQFIKDTVRGIRIALRNVFLEFVCVVFILLITIIPLVNILQPFLLWLVSAYFLGFSLMDYSLERKQLNTRNSVDYIKRNKSMATSIGTVFQLLYFIPIVGWMIAPTYGAVTAYFAIEEIERLKD